LVKETGMTQDRDDEMEGLMDGIVDEMKESMEEGDDPRQGTSSYDTGRKNGLIIGGVGALVLIVLIVVFLRGGGKPSGEDLSALQAKVNYLGQKMLSLEQAADKVALLEKQQKGDRQSAEEEEKTAKALNRRIADLDRKLDAIQKRVAALEAKKATEAPAPTTQAPSGKTRFHQVSRGDTLYSISRKYGISVKELRRLNSALAEDQVIHPGQKLLVAP
jgi:LysM repeat protein